MNTSVSNNRNASVGQPWVLLLIAVCLVAANMRMTISGVGPLLDEIADDRGISAATLGALGSVPLIGWAVVSPFAHGLSARIGLSNAVSVSLVLLAGGTIWRSLDGSNANLWLGTALIGVGLAIANVLMPAVIKRDFPERLALVMGLYSALLGGFGAITAGLAVPLSHAEVGGVPLGWRVSLLLSGALLPVGLVVWMIATRSRERSGAGAQALTPQAAAAAAAAGSPAASRSAGRRVWGDPVAWLVSLYMGSQSTVFYVLATWFPTYQVSIGYSPVAAGIGLMVFQGLGIVGSLVLPVALRGRLQRWTPALLPVIGAISWIGMLVAPAAMPLWIAIGGVIGGALLTMSLTLMATRARTHSDSSAVSGMAQAVGYSLAAIGPAAFGIIHELNGGWAAPFAVIWVAAAMQFGIGLAVGRPRFVFERAGRS